MTEIVPISPISLISRKIPFVEIALYWSLSKWKKNSANDSPFFNDLFVRWFHENNTRYFLTIYRHLTKYSEQGSFFGYRLFRTVLAALSIHDTFRCFLGKELKISLAMKMTS